MRKYVSAIVVALAALLVALAMLRLPPGMWYHSSDEVRYPYLFERFLQDILHGIWYPRWLPTLMGGYGYPTFVFYQPAFFYLMLPFAWLGPLGAVKAAVFIVLAAGGAGAYFLARIFHPKGWSAGFAALYLFTPYVAADLYMRGDLSELTAIMLCPGCFYFLLLTLRKMGEGKNWELPAAGLAAATSLIIYAHPFIAFFWVPFLVLAWAVQAPRFWREGLLLLALAATLTAPYWMPPLDLAGAVLYQPALSWGYDVRRNLIPLTAALGLQSFWLVPEPLTFYYQWGAIVGFALAWRKGKLMRAAAIAYVLGIYLISDLSLPVWVWGYPVLKFIQFPWRIFGVLATLQFLGLLHLGIHLRKILARRPQEAWLFGVLAGFGLLLFAAAPFHLLPSSPLVRISYGWEAHRKETAGFVSMQAANDFMPAKANIRGLADRFMRPSPEAELIGPGALSFLPGSSPWRLLMRAQTKGPARLRLNQFYFPGWRVEVNGLEKTPEIAANGRLRVDLPQAGNYIVSAWYNGPPGWLWRNIFMLPIAGIILLRLYRLRSRT